MGPPVSATASGVPPTRTLIRCDITGRRVRNVVLVAHDQLQRVLARLERNLRFGLAGAEMQMIEVVGNRLVERRQLGVDQ